MIPFVGLGVFVLMTICCLITSFLPFKNQSLSAGYLPKPPQQTNSPFSYLTFGEPCSNEFLEGQDCTEISQRKKFGLINEQKSTKKDDPMFLDLKQNTEQIVIKTPSDSGKGSSEDDDRSSNSSKTGNLLQPSSSSTSLVPNSSESGEEEKGKTDSVRSSTSSSATDLPILFTGVSDTDNNSSDEQKKVDDTKWNEILGSFMNNFNLPNNTGSKEVDKEVEEIMNEMLDRIDASASRVQSENENSEDENKDKEIEYPPSVKQSSDDETYLFPLINHSSNYSRQSSETKSHLNIPQSSKKHTEPSSTDGKSVLESPISLSMINIKAYSNSRKIYRRWVSENDLSAIKKFINRTVNSEQDKEKDIESLNTQFMPFPESTEQFQSQKQQQSQQQQHQQQSSVQITSYYVTHATERTFNISIQQTESEKTENHKAKTEDKKKGSGSLRRSFRRSFRKLPKKLSKNSSERSTGKSFKKSLKESLGTSVWNVLKCAGRKVGIVNESKTPGQLKGKAKKTIKDRNSH